MLELSRRGADRRVHHGGDVVNTGVHLVRLGHSVRLLSAIGDDPMSNLLLDLWHADGIDIALVRRIAGGRAGVYAITVDPNDERSFTYRRSSSAARRTLEGWGLTALGKAIGTLALAYLSLITVAVLGSPRTVSSNWSKSCVPKAW